MTSEQIIEMAQQCGLIGMRPHLDGIYFESLEAFAKLVAEKERERIKFANAPEIERVNAHIKKLEDEVLAEREACAKIVEESSLPDTYSQECLPEIANDIRARGQE
jgi:hypothetical protein